MSIAIVLFKYNNHFTNIYSFMYTVVLIPEIRMILRRLERVLVTYSDEANNATTR
jgi:hypothetical protein